ncbi:MAG: HAD-IG family 5'-nucleotidase [Planctomycetota bacterium]
MTDDNKKPRRRRRRKRLLEVEKSLPWWHELVSSTVQTPVFANHRAIFTNRTLRLERIGAVGFDFDHTLAVYNNAALDSLALKLVTDRLIQHEGVSKRLVRDLPEPEFARKGLIIDLELGIILKTDRYGHVKHAYHGKTQLTSADKRKHYGRMDVIPHVTQGKRFIQADTAFAHPEVLLFAALAPHQKKSCVKLWRTIRKHTDIIHRDNSLKSVITADPFDYLTPDSATVSMLKHLRDGGKKVFLLTNSEWEYTRSMMRPALGLGVGQALDWLELFDLVVVESRKPSYFDVTGSNGKARVLGPDNIIAGGNITHLEKQLGCSGNDILYVGDHIYGDLITSKRNQNWRTMLVVEELEQEMLVRSTLPGMTNQMQTMDERRNSTERIVQHWKNLEESLDRLPADEVNDQITEFREECARNRKQAIKALRFHIRKRDDLRRRLAHATNKYWGSLFRAGSELTYYGRQLEDFACTYTSRATNLSLYSADHYFRSAMDYLPHEIE